MRMNPASSSFRSDLAGVWRRLQVLPDDEAGATVSAQRPTVVRLQAGPWFAQWMQEPAERAVPAVPLCDLAPMQLAALTTPNVPELAALGGHEAMQARGVTYLAKGGDA